ncbi:MAG: hypothetical protein OHK0046_30510 [Anaerolineae bacterium]
MKKVLSESLVLRSLSEGVASDRANIGPFYQEVFGEDGDVNSHVLDVWTKDLVSEKHPTVTLDDIWVVVDTTRNDAIVSAVLLIPQRWRYEEVAFGLGRVEIVATDKNYRRRGLVRELFTAAHERSAALGHVMQGVTGIPHYYRRFGYGMSLDLGARAGLNLDVIPALPEGETPKFTLRLAGVEDIPLLLRWGEERARNHLVTSIWTEAMWRYELTTRNPESHVRTIPLLIVNQQAEPVGYLAVRTSPVYRYFSILSYYVGEESSLLETFLDVMRGCQAYIEAHFPPDKLVRRVGFDQGLQPGLEAIIRAHSSGVVRESVYAWYIRVPDLVRFLEMIKPVLERRLEGSAANRYTGEFKISFYDTTGLTMTFDKGKITHLVVGDLYQGVADAAFPYHTFLNIVLGRNTVAELETALPEIYAGAKAHVLLEALFPKKRSWVLELP